jgi:hypothetical protein
VAEDASGAHERLQTGGVDAVIIGEQQLHPKELKKNQGCSKRPVL